MMNVPYQEGIHQNDGTKKRRGKNVSLPDSVAVNLLLVHSAYQ